MVPLKANDGTLNGIDLSAPVPTWSTLINEADSSKRWFPLPQFENVELPKADSQFEEANSGKMAFTSRENIFRANYGRKIQHQHCLENCN